MVSRAEPLTVSRLSSAVCQILAAHRSRDSPRRASHLLFWYVTVVPGFSSKNDRAKKQIRKIFFGSENFRSEIWIFSKIRVWIFKNLHIFDREIFGSGKYFPDLKNVAPSEIFDGNPYIFLQFDAEFDFA